MLLTAAHKALDTLAAIYRHVNAIEEAGGVETDKGQALAADFLWSLQRNRPVVAQMIAEPLRQAVLAKAS
jgi:hypothetical protein